MLHGHGDDIYNQAHEIKANFSSNVPNVEKNADLINFWTQNLHFMHSYPEANAESFVEVFAAKHKLNMRQIIATHGATEAIYLIAQAFNQNVSTILQPTFAEYFDSCNIFGHQITHVYNEDDLQNVKSGLVWICNPNNPTGRVYNYDKLLQIIDKNVNITFIIDQTYKYFTKKQTLSYQDAVSRENVILIDSFTKRYSVPGLRLGYIVGNELVIRRILDIKQPWTVNQLAIETGKFLLKNENIIPLDVDNILANRSFLQQELASISNINVYPTDTHFFLCKLNKITAQNLKKTLITKYGILIRNADNFIGLDEHFIRIATQKQTENELLVDAMKQNLHIGNL